MEEAYWIRQGVDPGVFQNIPRGDTPGQVIENTGKRVKMAGRVVNQVGDYAVDQATREGAERMADFTDEVVGDVADVARGTYETVKGTISGDPPQSEQSRQAGIPPAVVVKEDVDTSFPRNPNRAFGLSDKQLIALAAGLYAVTRYHTNKVDKQKRRLKRSEEAAQTDPNRTLPESSPFRVYY